MLPLPLNSTNNKTLQTTKFFFHIPGAVYCPRLMGPITCALYEAARDRALLLRAFYSGSFAEVQGKAGYEASPQ